MENNGKTLSSDSEAMQSSAVKQGAPAAIELGPWPVQRPGSIESHRIYLENPVPTFIYDCITFQIIEANEAAGSLYGYSRTDLSQLSVLELFTATTAVDRLSLETELRKTLNTLGPRVHQTASKQRLSVRMILLPLSVPGHEARVAIIQDETAKQSAEEALRNSEERFRDLFENANDVIFLHDLKGKVLEINRAAEYLTGYSRQEVVGRNFEELIAPEARSQTQDNIRNHLGGSATQHYELPILSKFGTRRFLEVSTRILYRRGHPVAIQGIGRDVTERKLAQQRLLESAQELRSKNEELSTALGRAHEATQLKEQFLANTSHELRTPLNGIMGMIDLLKNTPLEAEQREYTEIVGQCANDLLTIINDILDLSQIEAGRLSLAEEEFQLRESLTAVVKLLRVRADQKSLRITWEISPRLPERVCGDGLRFRQVLTNLLGNAIKFTLSGVIHLNVAECADDAHFCCKVIDSGIGVDETVSERIFDAFFQADGTHRRRFGGTGLGLTISRQLIGIMGGRIGMYNNRPGPGSTFWFQLPLYGAREAKVSLPETKC